VLARLSTTPLQWRRQIRLVAIDVSAVYRTAIRTACRTPPWSSTTSTLSSSRTRC
jgi:hypothetical protein